MPVHLIQESTCGEINKNSYLIEALCQNSLYEMIPEFSKFASILAIIPATSCSVERSFSRLERLKTYLRNKMGQNRLNSLAIYRLYCVLLWQ